MGEIETDVLHTDDDTLTGVALREVEAFVESIDMKYLSRGVHQCAYAALGFYASHPTLVGQSSQLIDRKVGNGKVAIAEEHMAPYIVDGRCDIISPDEGDDSVTTAYDAAKG